MRLAPRPPAHHRSSLVLLTAAMLAAAVLLLMPGRAEGIAGDCRLIPVPAATPIGTGPCDGVRPGALVETEIGLCTLNFIFTGSDGLRYAGTAGHCVIEAPPTGGDFGEEVWQPGQGPEARDGEGNRIGEFAYAVLEDSRELDFALIRLDAGPAAAASSQMCHFGGPTGLNAEAPPPAPPTVLHHFGNGVGVGTALPGRSAIALGMPDPKHVFAEGAVVPGDSGSGAISEDGRAVGVIVTTGLHLASIGGDGVDAGTVGILRLAPLVAAAETATGLGFSLEIAPLL